MQADGRCECADDVSPVHEASLAVRSVRVPQSAEPGPSVRDVAVTHFRRIVNAFGARGFARDQTGAGCQVTVTPGSPGGAANATSTPMPGAAASASPHQTSGSARRSHGGMPASCSSADSARRGRLAASCRRSPPARERTRNPVLGHARRGDPRAVRLRERDAAMRQRELAPRRTSARRTRAARARGRRCVRGARRARRPRARASRWRRRARRRVAPASPPGAPSTARAGRAGAGTSAAGCARDAAAARRASRGRASRPSRDAAAGVERREVVGEARRVGLVLRGARERARRLRKHLRQRGHDDVANRIAPVPVLRVALVVDPRELRRARVASIAARGTSSSGRTNVTPRAPACAAGMPASPCGPAPRSSCSSSVSAWSSRWCASATKRTPVATAASASAA